MPTVMECFQNLSLQIPVRLMALGLSEKGMSKPISLSMHHQVTHFFLVLHYKVLLYNVCRAFAAKHEYREELVSQAPEQLYQRRRCSNQMHWKNKQLIRMLRLQEHQYFCMRHWLKKPRLLQHHQCCWAYWIGPHQICPECLGSDQTSLVALERWDGKMDQFTVFPMAPLNKLEIAIAS